MNWTARGAPITCEALTHPVTGERGGAVTFDGTRCRDAWFPKGTTDEALRVGIESEVFAQIQEALEAYT